MALLWPVIVNDPFDIDKLVEALTAEGHYIDHPLAYPHHWNRQTPLFIVANRANVPAIETLVRFGSRAIDTPDDHGYTPIHWAAWTGRQAVVEALVRLGSTAIDAPSEKLFGGTPIHLAAQNGFVCTIEALVAAGSKAIDQPDKLNRTPLFLAAQGGHVDAIVALVRLGSRAIDTPCHDYSRYFGKKSWWSPLHQAASNGHASAIETLVRLGSQALDAPDTFGWTPMHFAAMYSRVQAIETLFRMGSQALHSLDKKGQTPFHVVADLLNNQFQSRRSVDDPTVSLLIEIVTMLKCLGADQPSFRTRQFPETVEQLQAPIPEDKVAEVRLRTLHNHKNTTSTACWRSLTEHQSSNGEFIQ